MLRWGEDLSKVTGLGSSVTGPKQTGLPNFLSLSVQHELGKAILSSPIASVFPFLCPDSKAVCPAPNHPILPKTFPCPLDFSKGRVVPWRKEQTLGCFGFAEGCS